MDYFLPLNEINNTKENSLDGIKCVAQYSITEEEGESFIHAKVTIKNHSILCQKERENVKKFLYPGKFVSNKLETVEVIDTSLKNMINLRTVGNECTFLSIRDDAVNDKRFEFENGKELLFDHAFTEILEAQSNENYLAIITGGFNHDDTKNCQKETCPCYLVLLKFIKKSKKEDVLMEISRTNLDETFLNFKLIKIIFNANLSSRLLLIMQSGISVYLVTLNLINLQFSSTFQLEKELNLKLFFNPAESDGTCGLRDVFYYFYHNILKDVVIIVDNHHCDHSMVYVLKVSLDNCLYIYKSATVPMVIGYGFSLCNNRNNEILLLCAEDMDGYERVEIEEEVFYANVHFLAYDILKEKLYKRLCVSYINVPMEIFFNRTGEEIFIVKDNTLSVFV